MKSYHIAVIGGDGIGPECCRAATDILSIAAKKHGFSLIFSEYKAGGAALDAFGEPLPAETLRGAEKADSVLLGAVGGPKWDGRPDGRRPEEALLGLRKALGLYTNLRPASLYPALADRCPLSGRIASAGFDILIVRELCGGLYFGESGREGDAAFDTERYTEGEIRRVLCHAVAAARKRKKHLTLVDKANVLESSRLWREVCRTVMAENTDILFDTLYVDNAAMQLVREPARFDVIVTSNLFGDILSDEAAALTGSIGLLPSASLGEGSFGMYEPVHGSAPDIAGQGIANPVAAILSAAMMLRYSFAENDAAADIEKAVERTICAGILAPDLGGTAKTAEITEKIREFI